MFSILISLLCFIPFNAHAEGLLPSLTTTDSSQLEGFSALALFALIAFSTLISEDLTCIGAGLLAAQGRTSFALAAGACLAGIYVGDLLLFLAGRYLGRPALRRAPLRWFFKPEEVERSSDWFRRRGGVVIMLSRFLPGTRLPTYFAAGLLETSFWKFSLYFLVAAAVWTPLLVGLSMLLGAEIIESSLLAGRSLILKALLAGIAALAVVKLAVRLATYRGRRLVVSRWRRLVRWEFWPPWVFYPPVVLYVALLGLKHRGLIVFTCANPGIPEGGFIGESKIAILRGLAASPASQPFIARAGLIEAALPHGARLDAARRFMNEHGLSLPVVLKPDAGQRGAGVCVVKTEDVLDDYLRRATGDTIIQEHAGGFEFGVFYYRYPGEERGRIFAITDKRFPSVTGDGASTLERLILADERAVCMARTHFEKHAAHLGEVPRAGERVALVELGTHCRGALFLDGSDLKTPELERAIDRLSRGFEGFYFGRYDIRTPSVEDFQRGENFKVVELNGVTSEATNIYDPRHGLFTAYKILFEQWRIAFRIGALNRARGARPTSPAALLKLIFAGLSAPKAGRDTADVADGNIQRASGI